MPTEATDQNPKDLSSSCTWPEELTKSPSATSALSALKAGGAFFYTPRGADMVGAGGRLLLIKGEVEKGRVKDNERDMQK